MEGVRKEWLEAAEAGIQQRLSFPSPRREPRGKS